MSKRHSEADPDYDEGKRARRDPEVRVLVPSKHAGAIIGKGGETIKRLRSEFNASVNVPDSPSPERILVIAADYNSILDILRDVGPKIQERRGREDETEIRVLVHQSHAGAIIGRAGYKIKELREETHTEISVYSECCPASTERVVGVTGALDDVLNCLRRIFDICDESPPKGPVRPYDSVNYDPLYIHEYGGFPPDRAVGGGPGSAYGGFRGGPPRRGGRGGGDYGGRGDFDRGRDFMPPGRPDFMPPGRGLPPLGMGMGPGGGPMQTTQVTIPSDLGGTIIGKGGQRINQIRDESGAHIVVDPPARGADDERVITISGTSSQIQMAQYLLQQCVRASPAGRRYIQEQQGR